MLEDEVGVPAGINGGVGIRGGCGCMLEDEVGVSAKVMGGAPNTLAGPTGLGRDRCALGPRGP